MQTLRRQRDCRLFWALTQGLQAIPAQIAVFLGVRAANNAGVSGPNNVMTWMGVMDAKWAGPLSFVTKSSLRQYKTKSCRSVTFPASETQRSDPISLASRAVASASSGAPVSPTNTSE